jgi:hypothetical protein
MSGSYTLQQFVNGCASEKSSIDIKFTEKPPIPKVPKNISVQVGDTIVLNIEAVANGSAFYSWTGPNNFKSSGSSSIQLVAEFSDSGLYAVTQTILNCKSDEAEFYVKVLNSSIMFYYNVLTESKDGHVSFLKMKDLSPVSKNHFIIYDASGRIVYLAPQYRANWEGTALDNQELLPNGTYYFLVDYEYDGKPNVESGFIVINR